MGRKRGSATMTVFVYMLRCSGGHYYVGSTRSSLEQRVSQHNEGTFGGYTTRRRPVVLVWSQDFEHVTDAIAIEQQLKGWSRAKKEALIRGDWDAVRALASRAARETA